MDKDIKQEINIKDLSLLIINYKWLIIIITIISICIGILYLMFQPTIYSANAIIKVKDSNKNEKVKLLTPQSTLKTVNIEEDITLLKTFYINNQALNFDKSNFRVQYYKNNGYKNNEFYGYETPIKLYNIEIIDKRVIGKRITLISKDKGTKFSLKFKKNNFFSKSSLKLENHIYSYDKEVSTKYFRFKIKKLANFNKDISFKINGNNREIYEKIIKKNLSISQVGKDVSILKIVFKDTIQKRAIAYVNLLTKSIRKESIKNKTEQSEKVLEFIRAEVEDMKNKLKSSEKGIEKYRVSHKAIKPSIEASTLIRELSKLDIELSENRLKENLIQNIINYMNNHHNISAIAPTLMELEANPTLNLINTLENVELEKDKLLIELTPKHPDIRALNSKIIMLKRKIRLNIKNLKKHIYQKSYNLKRLISSYNNKLKRLPIQERKLVNIKRDYKVSSNMYNFLLKKQTENKIFKVAILSDYRVIDKAYSSNSPVSPKRKIIMVIFTLLGFIIAIIIAYIHNELTDKIRYKKQINSFFPIYGTIPFLEKNNMKNINILDNLNSNITEEYRTLRTNIQLILNKNKNSLGKVILITSTKKEDGKNNVITNLSNIFQIANYKTITIDLDLREANIKNLFNIEKNINRDIVSYINRDTDYIDDIIYPTKYNNLHIIPAKNRPSNPSELLLSDRLNKLISNLKNHYDYIIINTTPIGDIVDTKHILKYSDINLIVLRQDVSKKKFLLNINDIDNVGVVFIGNR